MCNYEQVCHYVQVYVSMNRYVDCTDSKIPADTYRYLHIHTIQLAFYTKRVFTVKYKNLKKRCSSERLVYQYHFTDWPDHGVPCYIMPVLTSPFCIYSRELR